MADYVWGDKETQFFYSLSPELILNSVDNLGIHSTGRVLTLNSMENRVYEVEIDPLDPDTTNPSDHFVVAKFYRPGRWSEEQIREEHAFLFDLQEAEMSVIAPLKFSGESLFQIPEHKIFYALFPKKGGRPADEMNKTQLERMGRLLARLHLIGSSKMASHRLKMNPLTFGQQNIEYLLSSGIVPESMREVFASAAHNVIEKMKPLFEGVSFQRIHGDCHLGNVIMRDDTPYLIDFDDMVMGPVVQDIWLQIPGRDEFAIENRSILLEAYEEIAPFPYEQLRLIEPLRTLRYIHFAAWIGKRWEDQSFQLAFPHYQSPQYWNSLIHDLYEQNQLIPHAISEYQWDSY